MNPPIAHLHESTEFLNALDQQSFRSMYGWSGSIYVKGAKASNLLRLSKTKSAAKIKVLAVYKTAKLVNGVPHTPVDISVQNWAGKVHTQVLVPGGCAGGLCLIPGEHMDLGDWKAGTEFVAVVRDADDVVLAAHPVIGSKVQLPNDKNITDDVDGGNARLVDITKFRGKARKAA